MHPGAAGPEGACGRLGRRSARRERASRSRLARCGRGPPGGPARPRPLQLADRRMYARKATAACRPGARPVRAAAQPLRTPARPRRRPARRGRPGHRGGRDLEMSPEELDDVALAAELHDMGKTAIPDAISTKPGSSRETEWVFMRRHTIIGERILMAGPGARTVARLVRSSHERWDGGGYPDGLAGEEIPLGARIVAVCDAFDAMTTDRPYRDRRRARPRRPSCSAAPDPVRPAGRGGVRARPGAGDGGRRGGRRAGQAPGLRPPGRGSWAPRPSRPCEAAPVGGLAASSSTFLLAAFCAPRHRQRLAP